MSILKPLRGKNILNLNFLQQQMPYGQIKSNTPWAL